MDLQFPLRGFVQCLCFEKADWRAHQYGCCGRLARQKSRRFQPSPLRIKQSKGRSIQIRQKKIPVNWQKNQVIVFKFKFFNTIENIKSKKAIKDTANHNRFATANKPRWIWQWGPRPFSRALFLQGMPMKRDWSNLMGLHRVAENQRCNGSG